MSWDWLVDHPWAHWWLVARLSVGAFLTSPGAGILGLIGAGYLAYRGVQSRLDGDQEIADRQHKADLEQESRERWQWWYDHLWENREEYTLEGLTLGAQGLRSIAESPQQALMLDVLVAYIESKLLVRVAEEEA